MSIKDVIKNGFLSKFMDNISVLNVSVTLILAFVLHLIEKACIELAPVAG